MSKQCSKCGTIVDDRASYCPQCGNYVAGDQQSTVMTNNTASTQTTYQQQAYQQQAGYQQYDQNQGGYQQQAGAYDQQYDQNQGGYQQQAGTYDQQYYQNQGGYQQQYYGTPQGAEESGLLISYKKFWKNYIKFDGRSRRSDFWWAWLVNMIINSVLSGIVRGTAFTAPGVSMVFNAISIIYAIACIVPLIAIYIRRLHDIGRPGTHILFALIPIVGWIILIVWMCKESVPGPNQYGPNPKGVN